MGKDERFGANYRNGAECSVGISEKVDSSLGTALTSRSNTSGPVSGEPFNLIRERDVFARGLNGQKN